jgi:hypothetical protein
MSHQSYCNGRNQPPPENDRELIAEIRALRREQAALRRLLDQFFGVYLDSRFPYGKPIDRWRRSA